MQELETNNKRTVHSSDRTGTDRHPAQQDSIVEWMLIGCLGIEESKTRKLLHRENVPPEL